MSFQKVSRGKERNLCLDAMIAKLKELGYDVGCKIFWEHLTLT